MRGSKREADEADDLDAKRRKEEEEDSDDASDDASDDEGSSTDDSDASDDEDDSDASADSDDDASASDSGSELNLLLGEDGRVPFAGMRHVALDAFRVFPRFLPPPSAPATADALAARLVSDCRVAFTARAARADKQYSSGETFWLAADAQPRCALEHLARRVFDLHVPAAARRAGHPADHHPADAHPGDPRPDPDPLAAAPPYDPARSGAEWWTQVLDPRDDIGVHWDKDYALEASGVNLHPHVGTVTYVGASVEGAPTLVARVGGPVAFGESVAARAETDEDGACAYASYPFPGKHIAFDGRWIHGAPANLARGRGLDDVDDDANEENDDDETQTRAPRVTFLVNVWLNHAPGGAAPFPEDAVARTSKEPYPYAAGDGAGAEEEGSAEVVDVGNDAGATRRVGWRFRHAGETFELRGRVADGMAKGGASAPRDGATVKLRGGAFEVVERKKKRSASTRNKREAS
jgi:hypothetical protein